MDQEKCKKHLTQWTPKPNKVRSKKVETKSAATFQESLRATLLIGQLFSLMPVLGLLSNNANDVKFVKTSWKCAYTLLSIIGQIFMTALCVSRASRQQTTLNGTTPIIFYGTACITTVTFFRVARKWPALVRTISRAEDLDPNFDSKLTTKCNVTCIIVLSLAMVEHILSLMSAFASAQICYPNKNMYESFVTHFYPWVFNILPYSLILGGLTQFLHFQSTLIWNFSDLFVICISYYLTSRLEQVNKKLLVAQGKTYFPDGYQVHFSLGTKLSNSSVWNRISQNNMQLSGYSFPEVGGNFRKFTRTCQYLPEVFWRSVREEYGRATQLVRRVDDVISGIVFISFANNLFFICLQLFNTLEDGIKGTGECSSRAKKTTLLHGYEAAAYFLFSLVYLISRSVAVSLIASQVNTATDVPAPVLYGVPSPVYCIEVQRFLDQVHGEKVALSGLQFFSVTRSLLLTVAGTIVTYELVMFQFNTPSPTHGMNITSATTPAN